MTTARQRRAYRRFIRDQAAINGYGKADFWERVAFWSMIVAGAGALLTIAIAIGVVISG